MTAWFVYLSYLAAANPARLRPALPETGGRARAGPLVGGVLITMVVTIGLIAVSSTLLEALEITPETWRIAAGLIAALVGIRVVVLPQRPREPELGGLWKALVPVAFPLLITPELVALTSIYGATESGALAVGGLAVALIVDVAAGLIRHRTPLLWAAAARFLGAFLILAGLALVVEGIRDV